MNFVVKLNQGWIFSHCLDHTDVGVVWSAHGGYPSVLWCFLLSALRLFVSSWAALILVFVFFVGLSPTGAWSFF